MHRFARGTYRWAMSDDNNNIVHLCPAVDAAGYLALKKYHDLEIWPWPTCRSILGDGIRKKNIFQPKVFFFEFTNL